MRDWVAGLGGTKEGRGGREDTHLLRQILPCPSPLLSSPGKFPDCQPGDLGKGRCKKTQADIPRAQGGQVQSGTPGKSRWAVRAHLVLGDGVGIEETGKEATSDSQDRRGRSVPSECVIAVRPSPPDRSLPWPAQCSHFL